MEGGTPQGALKGFQAKLLSYLHNCQAALLGSSSERGSWVLTFLWPAVLLRVVGRICGTCLITWIWYIHPFWMHLGGRVDLI